MTSKPPQLALIEFEGQTLFQIPPEALVPTKAVTFPVSIHLPINRKIVLVYAEGAMPSEKQLDKYRRNLKYFVCPEKYQPAYRDYLRRYNPDMDPTLINVDKAKEALQDGTLTAQQKKDILRRVGEKMIGVLGGMASVDEAERAAAFDECKNASQELVNVAMQSHKSASTYQDLLMMQQEGIEHSASVSTIAVIFALATGFVENEDLAEISMGALLHDLGHSVINMEIFLKPYVQFDETEMEEFKLHTSGGIQLLEDLGEAVPPLVRQVVEQHHERFDGKGFPAGISAFQVDERVQIVYLANQVDDLMSGRLVESKMSPVDAFDWIKEHEMKNSKSVSPEIFHSIDQILQRSKPTGMKHLGKTA
jgi:HD-GYP domain-containing protein (c-di-GMP phosphodiesterase class II)